MLALIQELLERQWEFSAFHMGETYVISVILGNVEHVISNEDMAIKLLDEIHDVCYDECA